MSSRLNAEVDCGTDEEGAAQNRSFSETKGVVRKSCCRYGSGCTHINDPSHREKFWHPYAPQFDGEQLKTNFICNECGYGTSSLEGLQLHLQRKTAWSNNSLVGCRINVLVDFKEWHEGIVQQFHKSGKHYVEFRQVGEKRWLVMKKIAFYILERPQIYSKEEESEYKDDSDCEGLAPVEDDWVYCEDITLDYAFAQSVLFKIFGNTIQETGHLTRGHTCLTEADRLNAQYVKSSLLYGELLPRGANKAFGPSRLDMSRASVVFDLGMGTGKILIQAFLQFKNLNYIFGIELSSGRYKLAEEALLKMVKLLGEDSYHVQWNPGKFIIVTEVIHTDDPDADADPEGYPEDYPENGNGRDTGRRGTGGGSGGTSPRSRHTPRSEPSPRSARSSPRSSPRSPRSARGEEGEGDPLYSARNRSNSASSDEEGYPRSDSGDSLPGGANRRRGRPRNGRHRVLSDSSSRSRSGSQDEHGSRENGNRNFTERVLHFQCGNMFDVKNINTADVVMMETDVPHECHAKLLILLGQMKPEAKVLTYLDLRKLWANSHLTFQQLEVNRLQADRYPTSWSVQRGHHFYLWSKVDALRLGSPGSDVHASSSWEWGRLGGLHKPSNSSSNGAAQSGFVSSESPITRKDSPATPFQRINSGPRSAVYIGGVPMLNIPAVPGGSPGNGLVGAAPDTQDSASTEMAGQEQKCFSFSYLFGFRRQKKGVTSTARPSNKVRSVTVAEFNASIALQEAERCAADDLAKEQQKHRERRRAETAALEAARSSQQQVTTTGGVLPPAGSAQQADPSANEARKHRRDRDPGVPGERITTMGTDSVRLRSPRAEKIEGQEAAARAARKKHKSERDRERAAERANKPDRREPVVRTPRQDPVDATGAMTPPGRDQEENDQPVSTLRRDASSTQVTAARSNSIVRSSTSLDAISNLAGTNNSAAVTLESLAHGVHGQADREANSSGKQQSTRGSPGPDGGQPRSTSRKEGNSSPVLNAEGENTSSRSSGKSGKSKTRDVAESGAPEVRAKNTNIEYLAAGNTSGGADGAGGSGRSRDRSRKSTRSGGEAASTTAQDQDAPAVVPAMPGGDYPPAAIDSNGRKRSTKSGRSSPVPGALAVEAAVLSAGGPSALDRSSASVDASGRQPQRGARIDANTRTQRGRAGAEETSESCVIS